MKIKQKHAAARATFSFGETELNYSFQYGTSHHDIAVDYFDIAPGRRHVAERDWARLGVGVLLGIAGFMAILVQTRYFGATAWSTLWLVPALLATALFVFRQSHFVVVQAGGKPVWIIEDKATSQIIAEIDRRRRDRIAGAYAPLNLANETYLEVRKVEWLVEQSVLTPDQAQDQIAKIHAVSAPRDEEEGEAAIGFDLFAREALAI